MISYKRTYLASDNMNKPKLKIIDDNDAFKSALEFKRLINILEKQYKIKFYYDFDKGAEYDANNKPIVYLQIKSGNNTEYVPNHEIFKININDLTLKGSNELKTKIDYSLFDYTNYLSFYFLGAKNDDNGDIEN